MESMQAVETTTNGSAQAGAPTEPPTEAAVPTEPAELYDESVHVQRHLTRDVLIGGKKHKIAFGESKGEMGVFCEPVSQLTYEEWCSLRDAMDEMVQEWHRRFPRSSDEAVAFARGPRLAVAK